MATRRPSTGSPPAPAANRLLGRLPQDDFNRIVPGLSILALERDQVLISPNHPVDRVFFPIGGVCVITVTTSDGQTAAAACIGREGVVGLTACGSTRGSAHRTVVAMPGGHAHVMDRRLFDREMDRGGAFASIIQTYVHGFVEVLLQSVACNALHSVEKRCARCLLDLVDRSGRHDLPIAQDQLATMLGVRRASITIATGALHRAGILDSGHALIHILDRAKLEAAACECYAMTRELLDIS